MNQPSTRGGNPYGIGSLAPRRSAKGADGLPLMMVALNLLLLCFFILLNSLATPPDQKPEHAAEVLARVREGYDILAPVQQPDGTVPSVSAEEWAPQTAEILKGIVLNRLQLQTVPLISRASRLTLTFPSEQFFRKGQAPDADFFLALQQAAPGANFRWMVTGPAPTRSVQAALLAQRTQAVAFRNGEPSVILTVEPGLLTPAASGRVLQRLGTDAGGSAEGSSRP